MEKNTKQQLSMIERVERALVLLAYFIELDGDVHLPMYEKFESELNELRQRIMPETARGGSCSLTRCPNH